jgi:hypothetical protein
MAAAHARERTCIKTARPFQNGDLDEICYTGKLLLHLERARPAIVINLTKAESRYRRHIFAAHFGHKFPVCLQML